MVITIGVREVIKNFNDLQTQLNLTQTEEDNFLSREFSLLPRKHELSQVLQILKKLGQI